MLIQTQVTPDVDVMNFFPDVKLLENGEAEFVDAKTMRKSPLAENIFDLGGICSVFITPDMISVKKCADAAWDDLKPLILAEIMDFLVTGEHIVISENPRDEAVVIAKIKGLLDARIRPAVQQDKGDIAFVRFENGIVYVEMKGACDSCHY